MIKGLNEDICEKCAKKWHAMDFALREYPFKRGYAYYAFRSEGGKFCFVVAAPSALKKDWFDILLNRKGEFGFWNIGTVPSKDEKTISDAVEKYNKKHNVDELVFD